MGDYKERFDKWQKDAKGKFEEIDDQLGLSDKLGEGVKTAKKTARKGAETLKDGVGRIKEEAEKTSVGKKAVEVAEDALESAEKTVKTAEEAAKDTAKKAWEASEPVREAAEEAAGEVVDSATSNAGDALRSAGRKAGDILSETTRAAGNTAHGITKALGLGISWTRTIDSTLRTVRRTGRWVQDKPLQAAATGVSVVVGAGAGVLFTGFSSHWLFNSALPAWSVKKASEKFNDHLKEQEKLISEGETEEADRERAKFERDIAKYVGAPLLGAFSFASGAVMMTNIVNPKTVTGAPISWLLGGNPVLEGAWFFGNGIACFKTSYDLFMISLEEDADVRNIVREIKGLLPQAG